MNKHLRLMAVLVLCAVVLVSAVSCHTTSSSVFDTKDDAGKLTVRYIGLKGYAEETYPGDCAIYTSPEGLVMMVDCGNQISYQELFPIMDELGIKDIDIFVMSHCHADHIGSLSEIARRYNIKKVYKNYVDYTSGTYKGAMMTINDQGIETEILYEGDSFKFGEFVDVEIFWPYEGQTVDMTDAADTNRSSIAMRITYRDSSFWSSGDLYIKDEITLMNKYGERIKSDVMKMNHHGRETSNGKEFIKTVSPKIAVAMQGEFSSTTIMNWYRSAGAVVFHTLFDGTVKISTSGDGHYDVQTQFVREKKNLYGAPSEDGHYVI